VLVVAGLVLSLLPRVPEFSLRPDVVLYLVLPPLLYVEAQAAPIEQMRSNWGWISSLSLTLVFVTTGLVALAVHWLEPDIPWAVAIMLGAIVAPTDSVAFSYVADRLRLPARVVAIIQGESLFNDALSLVMYKAALVVVMSGEFSAGRDLLEVFTSGIGAIVFGTLAGLLACFLWSKLKDTDIQTAISVVLPYFAYLPADRLHLSGVLAVVAAGIVVARFAPQVKTFSARLRFNAFSETGSFLINATLFLLVGLQLKVLEADTSQRSPETLLHDALILNLVIIGTRAAWIFGRGLLLRLAGRRVEWRALAVGAWAGLRGSVSLAAALAVPYYIDSGDRFPDHHYVLFMTFSVIVVTLIGQGLTLPLVIRLLNLDQPASNEQESLAMRTLADCALKLVEQFERDERFSPDVRAMLQRRFTRWNAAFAEQLDVAADGSSVETEVNAATALVIAEQRRALVDLQRHHLIENTTLRKIERLLDLQEAERAQLSYALPSPSITGVRTKSPGADSQT
jgi:CPA1 family monovalent cation:H+ antiporter